MEPFYTRAGQAMSDAILTKPCVLLALLTDEKTEAQRERPLCE